jgi:hypothetical protein
VRDGLYGYLQQRYTAPEDVWQFAQQIQTYFLTTINVLLNAHQRGSQTTRLGSALKHATNQWDT